ncbi:MAG TPA: MASE1 domain-containing protein [Anaerolineae bacterium]|nr:MASE1 domain-containing protein [Anaerolineae bacterium]
MTALLKTERFDIRAIAVYLLKLASLALVYHLAARLGLKMAYVQINTSPVWPPTGIALAVLLLFGYNLWPGISLGVLVGSLLTGAPVGVAVGIALGNTLEALVGAYCLKRFVGFHNAMDRIQDVVGLALCSIFSTALGASIGSMTLLLTGGIVWQAVGNIWITWWIGDLLGALVVAPVLLVWATAPSYPATRRMISEGVVVLALLAAVTWYVFGSRAYAGVLHQAMIYVIFPFMIWTALRLGQRGAATAVFLVSGIAIWATSEGMGPFSLESKNDSLVLLQTFMGVVSLTSLILAAAATERRKAADALHQRVEDLAALNEQNAWLFEEVRQGNQQLHALSQRLMKAQEEERLHLSRELHDESGQLVAALTMQLGLLEHDASQPEALNRHIAELKRATYEIQDNLHQLAVNLRPASLDHLGLVTALQQYTEEFGRKYQIQTDFEAVGLQGKRLPIEIEIAMFRIVQESLTNVALHARATHVDVLVNVHETRVAATIEDDGVGFAPSPSIVENTLGLFGMRERVEMLGGRLSVESAPGKGTTVTAEVPYHD